MKIFSTGNAARNPQAMNWDAVLKLFYFTRCINDRADLFKIQYPDPATLEKSLAEPSISQLPKNGTKQPVPVLHVSPP